MNEILNSFRERIKVEETNSERQVCSFACFCGEKFQTALSVSMRRREKEGGIFFCPACHETSIIQREDGSYWLYKNE